jgi:hypothetical protein
LWFEFAYALYLSTLFSPHKRMHRFTLRSKRKVNVQWTRTRFALVHNIGNIHSFGALI